MRKILQDLDLDWFRSYLTGQKQATVVEGSTSQEADVVSGVPQGSILGPLLFLLYINDMASATDERTKLALYADDAKLYCQIHTLDDCINLQFQLDQLHLWSQRWLLNFNI